jgi:hypothetical protein
VRAGQPPQFCKVCRRLPPTLREVPPRVDELFLSSVCITESGAGYCPVQPAEENPCDFGVFELCYLNNTSIVMSATTTATPEAAQGDARRRRQEANQGNKEAKAKERLGVRQH